MRKRRRLNEKAKKQDIEKQPVELVPDFVEVSAKDDDADYLQIKSCCLKVKNGPGVPIPVGAIVRLTAPTAKYFFYELGAVIPIGMKDGQIYEATAPIRTVKDGLYVNIAAGTRLSLSAKEAIELLRKRRVKAIFDMEVK